MACPPPSGHAGTACGGLCAVLLFLGAACMGPAPQEPVAPPAATGAPASDTSSAKIALSPAAAAKLDPALRKLLGVPEAPQGLFRYSPIERPDGATAYAVLLGIDDEGQALRRAGLPVEVVSGGLATSHLTRPQIAQAARLEAVLSIRNSPPERTSGANDASSP